MSDYFNSFANPQGGGGQDIPQPGTPAFYQWLQSIAGQGQPQPGGPPGPLAANPANLPASRNMANMSVVGLPSSSGFTLPDGAPAPMPDAVVRAGKGPAAIAAPPPPDASGGKQPDSSRGVQQPKPPAKRAPPAGPLAAPGAPGYLNSTSATPPGSPGGPAPSGAALAPDAAGLPASSVAAQAAQSAAAVTPSTGPLYPASDVSLYPHALIAGAPSNGAVPNLGYYRPTMGNAQGNPTWVPQGAQGAPQMFRGPLALPGSQNYYAQPAGAAPPPAPAPAAAPAAAAAAPVPGPIAPGVGTLWLRKLFGGGGQPTA